MVGVLSQSGRETLFVKAQLVDTGGYRGTRQHEPLNPSKLQQV